MMIELVANNKSSKVFEPADGSFYFPASIVSAKFSAVLGRLFDTALSVRRDEINSALFQTFAERITVGSSIVDQPSWTPSNHSLSQQWLDQCDFVGTCAFDHAATWQAVAIDQQHDLCAFARFRFAYTKAPFLAGEKVPSAIDCWRSTLPSRSSLFTNRAQAFSKIPDSVHCFSRRQQVGYEGKCFGKSHQRAPVLSTHAIASKQARAEARKRPPKGDGGGSANKSEIKPHWSSVSSKPGSILDPTLDSASAEWDRCDISLFPFANCTHNISNGLGEF
jgi:hypothetical protein